MVDGRWYQQDGEVWEWGNMSPRETTGSDRQEYESGRISLSACVFRSPSLQTCGILASRHVVIHSLFCTRHCVKLWAPLSPQPVSINQDSFWSKLIHTPGFCQCVCVCLLLTANSVRFCSLKFSWKDQRCGYTMDWVYDLTCKPNFHIY